MSEAFIELPVGPLPDLLAWWRSARVKGVIIGGLAVSLIGRPRVTRDVDAVVLLPENRWAAFLKKSAKFHFVPRLPDVLEFAKRRRVLLLHHAPTGVDLDISLGGLPFEVETVRRAKKIKVGRLSVPVATAEDLLVLKAVAGRDHDRRDISSLLDVNPDLDFAHVLKHADEFAQILEAPEIYTDLDATIREHKKKQRRKTK